MTMPAANTMLVSALAAIAAALVAGLAEAVLAGVGFWPGVCAAGFAAITAAPAGFALALLVRTLWRSWRPLADDPARAAGGLAFAALAILLAASAGWAGAGLAASLTHVPRLAALTVGAAAVVAGAIAALASAPAVHALARHVPAARIEKAAATLAAALSLLLWPIAPYLTIFAVVLIAGHLVPSVRRRGAAIAVVSAAVALAALTAYASVSRPEALVDARKAPIGGLAIRASGR
jgi:hypothetical protein